MSEQRAAAFLKGLQIKGATFGGFDKTDTFTKFKELAYIYEDILVQERSEREQEQRDNENLRTDIENKTSELEHLQEKLRKLETEKAELEKKVIEGTNTFPQKDPDQPNLEVGAIQNSEDVLKRAKSKAELILSDAQREAEELLISARSERDSILKTAHDDALRRRADLQNEVIVLKNEKKTILTELKAVQDQLDDVMHTVKDAGVLEE